MITVNGRQYDNRIVIKLKEGYSRDGTIDIYLDGSVDVFTGSITGFRVDGPDGGTILSGTTSKMHIKVAKEHSLYLECNKTGQEFLVTWSD